MNVKRLIFTVVLVLAPGIACAAPEGSEFYHALLLQDVPRVKDMLAHGADVNHREAGRPMLVWAAQSANPELVNALLEGHADVNAADEGIGHTPLMRAVETQNVEIVRLLLKAKANPNAKAANGESVLAMAIKSGKPEIVAAVIQAGADVKAAVDQDGYTPALLTVTDNQAAGPEIISLLAKAGADMNAANIIHTPLTYSTEQGSVDLVKALLGAGADANLKGPSGRSPIEYADKKEIVDLLIAAKADPNQVSDGGTAPLIRAIENGDVPVVEALLKGGAVATTADSYGNSAIQVAKNYSHEDIIALLKKHGAAE